MYSISGLFKRGEYFPQFPDVPYGVVNDIQIVYTLRYFGPHVVHPSAF